jgi:hypothetical protein
MKLLFLHLSDIHFQGTKSGNPVLLRTEQIAGAVGSLLVGTNLLRTLGKVINADFRADKPPEDAIHLAMMIVRGLIQRISVNADFYSPKLLILLR